MEGKLIKTDGSYCLTIIHERVGKMIIGTDNKELNKMLNYPHNLSLKNCQAIENGYDLGGLIEEVREEFYQSKLNLLGENTNKVTLVKETAAFSVGFDRGFKKALELLGDKKFSLEDMRKAVYEGVKIGRGTPFIVPATDDYLKSLQQTEWLVTFNPDEKDSDGCLILKRK